MWKAKWQKKNFSIISGLLSQPTGAILHYLPPYSLDYNPPKEYFAIYHHTIWTIYNPPKESFAKVKAFLKENEVAYDVTDDPRVLIMIAFNSVTEEVHKACWSNSNDW